MCSLSSINWSFRAKHGWEICDLSNVPQITNQSFVSCWVTGSSLNLVNDCPNYLSPLVNLAKALQSLFLLCPQSVSQFDECNFFPYICIAFIFQHFCWLTYLVFSWNRINVWSLIRGVSLSHLLISAFHILRELKSIRVNAALRIITLNVHTYGAFCPYSAFISSMYLHPFWKAYGYGQREQHIWSNFGAVKECGH